MKERPTLEEFAEAAQQERDSFTRAALPCAKKAAAQIVKTLDGKNKRPSNMRKLAPLDENSLAFLLVDILEDFICGSDGYDSRYGKYNPETGEGCPPRTEKQFIKMHPPQELPDGDVIDYGDDAGAGMPDWKEHWDRFHKRKRGFPGRNRLVEDGPPTALLYPAVKSLCAWYKHKRQGGEFMIRYYWPDTGGLPPENAERCEELFLKVAQFLDPRYCKANCKSVADNIRDPDRNARQRAKRAAKKGLSSRD